MKRWWWCALVLAMLAPAALAQGTPGADTPGAASFGGDIPAANKLVKATATPVTLGPGGTATTTVTLVVLPGWHINANPPALDYNIPTRVSLRGAFGVRAGTPGYPAPKKAKFAFEDSELWVWDGETRVTIPLAASATPVDGVHRLQGRVEYQGCNDQVCLAPASVPFTVEVTVTGGLEAGADSAGVATDPDTTAAPAQAGGTGFVTSRPADGGAPPAGNAA